MEPNHESRVTNYESLPRMTLFLATFCLAASCGFLTGRLISYNPSPVTLVPDTRKPIPTVHIRSIQNGLLHGNIIGSARVVFDKKVLTQSGIFAIDAGPLLRNEILIVVPDWAQFVASRKGKKYYPVLSSGGERITPANRVYFRSAAEAEGVGYKR